MTGTVMVIGASRGIGLELARQYAVDGWRVHATTRTPDRPGALGQLTGAVLHELDVRRADQTAALASAVAAEGIDVLIHNAGVMDRGLSFDEMMAINAEAPIRVTEALLDAVRRGRDKKIVLMTSQLGARYGSTRRLGTYGESKAALNDRFRELAPAWGAEGTDRHRHAPRLGAHRHGRTQRHAVRGGKRHRHAAGHCRPDARRARAFLDVGRA